MQSVVSVDMQTSLAPQARRPPSSRFPTVRRLHADPPSSPSRCVQASQIEQHMCEESHLLSCWACNSSAPRLAPQMLAAIAQG